ncbi:MAG: LysR family transcriptional regulator [Lachnospiraceae bacterium]|nr:LysR family transcriptional regulator [Lachnospiraceae bacterium]
MNFTELKYFQILYECGSFSAAADRIPMTIQGLRKAILYAYRRRSPLHCLRRRISAMMLYHFS